MQFVVTHKGEELVRMEVSDFDERPSIIPSVLFNSHVLYLLLEKLVHLYTESPIVTSQELHEAWSEAKNAVRRIREGAQQV